MILIIMASIRANLLLVADLIPGPPEKLRDMAAAIGWQSECRFTQFLAASFCRIIVFRCRRNRIFAIFFDLHICACVDALAKASESTKQVFSLHNISD